MSTVANELVVSTQINASPERVWQVLFTETSSWWPELSFEPHVGGNLKEVWRHEGATYRIDGHISGIVPNKRLQYVWLEPGWEEPLLVFITLEVKGDGTLVSATERGFESLGDGAEVYSDHYKGWKSLLASLKEQVER